MPLGLLQKGSHCGGLVLQPKYVLTRPLWMIEISTCSTFLFELSVNSVSDLFTEIRTPLPTKKPTEKSTIAITLDAKRTEDDIASVFMYRHVLMIEIQNF